MVMVVVALAVSAVACSRESPTTKKAGRRSTASVPEDEPGPSKTLAAAGKKGSEIVTEPMSEEEKTHQAGHARIAQESTVEVSSPESRQCVATLDLIRLRSLVGGKGVRLAYNRYLREGPREDVLQCAMEAGKRRTDCRLPIIFSVHVHVNTNGSSESRMLRNDNGGAEFGKCIQDKVRNWQFPKPVGMEAEFTLPMFVRFRRNRIPSSRH